MSLQWIDFLALSPLIILLFGAIAILLIEILDQKWGFELALVAFGLSFVATWYAPLSQNPLLTRWLVFDTPTFLFTLFFLLIGISCTLLAKSFFNLFQDRPKNEFYFLLIGAVFGLILVGAANDFLTLFIGIETLSLALYVLCGYMKNWEYASESAIKYFFTGSLAAAFLLYGIAFFYGATGTTQLQGIILDQADPTLLWAGIALITLGLAFEAAVFPFHIWAPDVYAGAATPVTAFMAVGTKVGAFAAFSRIFIFSLPSLGALWHDGIAYLAYPTLIYANLVALRQTEMRRFFAYSGIAHAGFLLIPLSVGTPEAFSALFFYLVVYALATLACFAALAFLDNKSKGVFLQDLSGLFYRSPFLGLLLTLGLLTLAGIPPMLGFFAKFYVFKIAFGTQPMLVIIGLLTSILAAFYYLRVAAILFAPLPSDVHALPKWGTATVLGAITLAALIVFSLYPAFLMI